MTLDPYKILKVRKNASAGSVKKAYRQRAMETHPDRGGDKRAFEDVNLAWQILSDHNRRAHYDATGEVEPAKPDNADSQTMGILSMVLVAVIKELSGQGKRPEETDVAQIMRKALDSKINELANEREALKKCLLFLVQSKGRFDGDLDRILESHLNMAEKETKTIEEMVAAHKVARAKLEGVRFRHTPKSGWDTSYWDTSVTMQRFQAEPHP